MIELPTKPRITAEAKRDDYAISFIFRTRRSWRKMSLTDRRIALLEAADQLDTYAQQMREESEMLGENAAS